VNKYSSVYLVRSTLSLRLEIRVLLLSDGDGMGIFDKGNILLPSLEFFPVERSLPDDDLYFGLLVLHEFKYDG
jgi:hypothetical protein